MVVSIFSAQKPDKTLTGRHVTCLIGAPDQWQPIQGLLTRAFVKLLDQHPESLNLRAIASELGNYSGLRKEHAQVLCHGPSLHLRSEVAKHTR
jgi:hypothetical protein